MQVEIYLIEGNLTPDKTVELSFEVKQAPTRMRLRVWAKAFRPPENLPAGQIPNTNLDIELDGTSYKTGLGDGTEKEVVDEIVSSGNVTLSSTFRKPGDHMLTFKLREVTVDTTVYRTGRVKARLEIEY
jgi:hypothetical protein